jgi:predicted nuclease of predicted toxin-antitoxin system
MKLLFDQNLSRRLPRFLADIYPESVHVREINMRDATDTQIWDYAKIHEFVIISKYSTFRHEVYSLRKPGNEDFCYSAVSPAGVNVF